MKFNTSLIKEIGLSDLMEKNGKITTRNVKNGVIFIGADWCGHCKNTKPEVERLALITGFRMPVLFINGADQKNSQVLKLLKVRGYPTFFLVSNYKLISYEGPRTSDAILATLCNLNADTCMLN